MSKKILIIDDDKTLTKLIGSFLTEQDYEVSVAHDGQSGLRKLEMDTPDLLLLDVVLPDINGYSFLFEMRKIEQAVKVPVIVLTCKEDLEDIFKVEGVKEYLVKPFNNVVLLEKIKQHI